MFLWNYNRSSLHFIALPLFTLIWRTQNARIQKEVLLKLRSLDHRLKNSHHKASMALIPETKVRPKISEKAFLWLGYRLTCGNTAYLRNSLSAFQVYHGYDECDIIDLHLGHLTHRWNHTMNTTKMFTYQVWLAAVALKSRPQKHSTLPENNTLVITPSRF